MLKITTTKHIEEQKKQSFEKWKTNYKNEILNLLKNTNFEIADFIRKLVLSMNISLPYNETDINTQRNLKIKTVFPSGDVIDSDMVSYWMVRAVSKLLDTPLYGYQEVDQKIVDTRPKMRWVCGVWPEFGHNNCPDCLSIWWPEDTWETEYVREPVFDRVEITPRKHEEVHMYMQGEIEKPTQREMDISTISHTLQLLFADLKSPLQNTLIDIYNLAKRCNCTREEIQALSTDERRQKFVDRMCIDIP